MDKLPSRQNTQHSNLFLKEEDVILKAYVEKPYVLTPYIVTFSEEVVTSVDIENYIQMGLKIVRFKMTRITRNDKIKLLAMLEKAVQWVCEKYDVSTWPIATCIDIPNACIRTGFLEEDVDTVFMNKETEVKITSDIHFWNKCSASLIFIDDPYTISSFVINTEITISNSEIVMICTEVVDEKTVKCQVVREGHLGSNEFVCVRGVKFIRPPLTKKDVELIQFAKEFKSDILTLHSLRWPSTLIKVKQLLVGDYQPLIMSTICEQEGLDNIDGIIELSDGIILAREFLAHSIVNKHQMTAIQMQVCAKCRKAGKPFYISGQILEKTLTDGSVSSCDLSDITNAVMQGSGFVFSNCNDPAFVLKAMDILNTVCKSVESLSTNDLFWRLSSEFAIPVNAAEACVLACALIAKQSGAVVVILPTVTGRTAIQLAHVSPDAIIITISRDEVVARKLQLFRGIIPIVYDKEPLKNFRLEMEARIKFGVKCGIKKNILRYGHKYVALHKHSSTSSFSDSVSLWEVMSTEVEMRKVQCDEEGKEIKKNILEASRMLL